MYVCLRPYMYVCLQSCMYVSNHVCMFSNIHTRLVSWAYVSNIHTRLVSWALDRPREAQKIKFRTGSPECFKTIAETKVWTHFLVQAGYLDFGASEASDFIHKYIHMYAAHELSRYVCMYAGMLSMYVCMLSMYVCMLSMYVCWACMYVCWACIVQGRRRQVQNPSACEGFCDSNST